MQKPIRFVLTDASAPPHRFGSYKPSKKMVQGLLVFLGVLVIFGLGLAAYQFRELTSKVIIANQDPDSLLSITQNQAAKTPIPTILKNRDRINILLIGLDKRDDETADITRADSLMMVSIKPEDKSVVMISIPRDLEVEFPPNSDEYVKINAVHNHPSLPDEAGAGAVALKQVVGKIFGIKIHYFARIDFGGFIKIVDEIGGVVVDVPERLYDTEYPNATYGYQKVDIPAGKQLMNGDIALKFARSRHASNPLYQSDENRASRQQQVLLAIKNKIQDEPLEILFNPQRINGVLGVLKDSFLTDIQISEMIELGALAKTIDINDDSKVIKKVLVEPLLVIDNDPGNWHFNPADKTWAEIQQWVTDLFENPLLRENLEQEAAFIGITNATSTSGLARKTKEKLSRYPFQFAEIANSDSVALQTRIIDYSNGTKANTLKFLEDFFDAKIEQPEKITPGLKAQIVVVLGEDYAEKEK